MMHVAGGVLEGMEGACTIFSSLLTGRSPALTFEAPSLSSGLEPSRGLAHQGLCTETSVFQGQFESHPGNEENLTDGAETLLLLFSQTGLF